MWTKKSKKTDLSCYNYFIRFIFWEEIVDMHSLNLDKINYSIIIGLSATNEKFMFQEITHRAKFSKQSGNISLRKKETDIIIRQ